jgi:integrase
MKSRILTDLFVRNAKVPGRYPDLGQRGLSLIVHKTLRKSWNVSYRHPISKISRKLTLQGGLGLADARKACADAMHLLSKGVDPIDDKRAKTEAAVVAAEGTVRKVCELYMSLKGNKLRSADYYDGVLEKHVYPHLGPKQVTELKRSEIISAFDYVERASGAASADMALAVLRPILRWYEIRHDTFRSPIVAGMARRKPADHRRKRVFDPAEIKRFWLACNDPKMQPIGRCLQFALLTGSRRDEARKIRRSEITTMRERNAKGKDVEYTVWRLPAARSKNKAEVIRPLSAAALDIVNNMPLIGDNDYVFTVHGRVGVVLNNTYRKEMLSEAAGIDVKSWRNHDLRRTARTILGQMRVPSAIAKMAIGQTTKDPIDETYDQGLHLEAMQEAVDKLAAEIERIVQGGGGKVIRIAR